MLSVNKVLCGVENSRTRWICLQVAVSVARFSRAQNFSERIMARASFRELSSTRRDEEVKSSYSVNLLSELKWDNRAGEISIHFHAVEMLVAQVSLKIICNSIYTPRCRVVESHRGKDR